MLYPHVTFVCFRKFLPCTWIRKYSRNLRNGLIIILYFTDRISFHPVLENSRRVVSVIKVAIINAPILTVDHTTTCM